MTNNLLTSRQTTNERTPTMNISVPPREGQPPTTTRPSVDRPFPHQQLDQNAPRGMQEALFQRVVELPGIRVGRSLVSLPDARAFHLDPELAQGPRPAFQRGTEFAHIHADYDGSLHLTLPPELYDRVLETGWGQPHPISGTMMLFGPRNESELEVVWSIVRESYRYANGGASVGQAGRPAEGCRRRKHRIS